MDDSLTAKANLPSPENCGYHHRMHGLELWLTLRQAFDAENKGQAWAADIIGAYHQPLQRVVIDLRHCPIVSSTVFAGLIQLAQAFADLSQDGIHLVNASGQVVRALKMLKIQGFFHITEAVPGEPFTDPPKE